MQYEVTNKHETREGIVFKKPIYHAELSIHLDDEEFDILKSMGKSKEWAEYPVGEVHLSETQRITMTMSTCWAWAKKSRSVQKNVRAKTPEDRELQIAEFREVATNLKQVIGARLSALSASDEDVLEEL